MRLRSPSVIRLGGGWVGSRPWELVGARGRGDFFLHGRNNMKRDRTGQDRIR